MNGNLNYRSGDLRLSWGTSRRGSQSTITDYEKKLGCVLPSLFMNIQRTANTIPGCHK